MKDSLIQINREIVQCTRCPRLVEYRARVAAEKRRAFLKWEYWGKPVPGFGDPRARVLLIGLAPAAHGGNRTGRVFTGDASGDFMFPALYRAGFANQPTSVAMNDGLVLKDAYVIAAVRCAPPDNKPLPSENANCREYLWRDLDVLKSVRVVIPLGKFAFDAYVDSQRRRGVIDAKARPLFGHCSVTEFPDAPTIVASYHPSQRNTQTGKLTVTMFDNVFEIAKAILNGTKAKK